MTPRLLHEYCILPNRSLGLKNKSFSLGVAKNTLGPGWTYGLPFKISINSYEREDKERKSRLGEHAGLKAFSEFEKISKAVESRIYKCFVARVLQPDDHVLSNELFFNE